MATTHARHALFFLPGMPPDKAQARYRALTKVLHPDVAETGDTRLMQLLNVEFEALEHGLLLPPMDVESVRPSVTINDATAAIRRRADEIIRSLPPFSGVFYEVDTFSRCIVAAGDSFPHKEALKKLGFKWAAMRRVWAREVIV
jgi:hypothetical protein